MNFVKLVGVAALSALLAACSTPEERAAEAQEGAYKAQESVSKQRLELVGKYQDCVKKAGGDKQKVEACDSYLRAAEALK
jgi:outer membrane biogenesis lipoprotein LolB